MRSEKQRWRQAAKAQLWECDKRPEWAADKPACRCSAWTRCLNPWPTRPYQPCHPCAALGSRYPASQLQRRVRGKNGNHYRKGDQTVVVGGVDWHTKIHRDLGLGKARRLFSVSYI